MQRERAHACVYVQGKKQKNGEKKKVPMETKELYLIGNNLASERSENRRLEGGSHRMCLTLCPVMHLLMVLYLFTGTDSFQSVQCNKCKRGAFWDIRDGGSRDPAHPHAHSSTHIHSHSHRRCQKNVPPFSVARVRQHLVPKNNQRLIVFQQCPVSLRPAGQHCLLNRGHLANANLQ